MNSLGLKILILFILIFVSIQTIAQDKNFQNHKRDSDTTLYHIDLLKGKPSDVMEIFEDYITFIYNDKYGKNNQFDLELYSWENQHLNSITLEKKFGDNYYKFSRQKLYHDWKEDETYSFVIKNDMGKKYTSYFKIMPPPDDNMINVDIIVNTIEMNCMEVYNNLVEFYGKIDGGKPPYNIEWEVSKNSLDQSLYQPKKESIPVYGYTSGIQVDLNPNYQVLLTVIDACGNEGYQKILVSCQNNSNNNKSILIQPLKKGPSRELVR